MQLPLKIKDRGNVRDALPIRAIPYVTYWNESPDSIVRTLAAPKTTRVGSLEIRNRHTELFAYQMDAQGHFEQVPPEQWESWVVTLDCLTKKSKADEREGAENENHASWRIKAVLELPDNVFVWLDEFQAWYSRNRPIIYVGPEIGDCESVTQEDIDGFVERENDRLCLAPILPPEIEVENKMWRYADGLPLAAVKQAPSAVKPAVKIETKETAAKGEAAPATSASDDDWKAQARVIADKCFDRDTANKCRDSLKGYSKRVMGEMQERGIKGPRGILDNANTVKREALQSKQWWANKPK